jgi:hypothetical protein
MCRGCERNEPHIPYSIRLPASEHVYVREAFSNHPSHCTYFITHIHYISKSIVFRWVFLASSDVNTSHV